ncbi:MAG: hypothetical protein HY074_09085 [Deltaproteobacteria bacterium]|nr:hypothetical protein [Deltaproteobacteria bacterium]
MKSPIILCVLCALPASLPFFAASACEVTSQQIDFKELGMQTAYYCKANASERSRAIEAVKNEKCISRKLREFGKPPLTVEANEVIPFGLTRTEASNKGPIFDIRLNVEITGEHRSGYRALAQAQRSNITQRFDFEVIDPFYFERECPVTGCGDRVLTLCESAHFP